MPSYGVMILCTGVISLLPFIVLAAVAFRAKSKKTLPIVGAGLAVFIVVVYVIYMAVAVNPPQANQTEWAAVKYDLALDTNELTELQFPNSIPNEPDVFGTIEELNIRLAWDGNDFILEQDPEEEWVELPH